MVLIPISLQCLYDFQGKVSYIPESVCFSLDNFNLIIDSFEFTRMDTIITVIEYSIAVSLEHVCKFIHYRVIYRFCQEAPLIKGFSRPCSRTIAPKGMFELIFKNQ